MSRLFVLLGSSAVEILLQNFPLFVPPLHLLRSPQYFPPPVLSRQQRRRLFCAGPSRRPSGAQVQPGLGRGHRRERAAEPEHRHSHGDVWQVQENGMAEGG